MKRLPTALILLASAGLAAAQEAAPAAAGGVPALASPTFGELFRAGGPLMWLLLAFSVFALAVIAWLFATLRAAGCVVRDSADLWDVDAACCLDAYPLGPEEGKKHAEYLIEKYHPAAIFFIDRIDYFCYFS